MKKIFIVISITGAILFGFYLFEALSLSPNCDSKVLWEKKSPDNARMLTAFTLDCGTTADSTVALTVRDAKDTFNANNGSNIVLTLNKAEHVEAQWIGNNQIEVLLPRGGRIFKQVDQWNSVHLDYKKE